MSLLTALLALVPFAVAKSKPARIAELVEVDAAERPPTYAELERENGELRLALNHARLTIEEIRRPDREAAAQRAHAMALQQYAHAQYAAQQNQNQNQYQNQLSGQQNAFQAPWQGFCNCVPARHDMFLRPGDSYFP